MYLKRKDMSLINSHFDYIGDFIANAFTKLQEKAILAQGELMSTALFHNLLSEKNIKSVLIPALEFYANRQGWRT